MAFQKGTSGNPNGRPKKGTSMTEILIKALQKIDIKYGFDTISRKEAIIEKVLSLALQGEPWAIKMVLEYSEGKPIQRVEQENKDISSVQAVFTSELKHFIEDEDDSE